MIFNYKFKQRGDTIIEVLLAMTVIGMSLAVSYGIANRAARTGQQAQERTQAVKLAETQLELLKNNLGEISLAAGYQDTRPYCILSGQPKVLISSPPDSASPCIGIQGLFDIRVEYRESGGVPVYSSVVLWDDPSRSVTGDEASRNIVELRYRP